jgi:hypothetical protein
LSDDFQWEQHQDDEQNTLFLCGKVLFLDDKLFCFWMTNCLFTFFMATEQQRHHWAGDEQKLAKKIMKKLC